MTPSAYSKSVLYGVDMASPMLNILRGSVDSGILVAMGAAKEVNNTFDDDLDNNIKKFENAHTNRVCASKENTEILIQNFVKNSPIKKNDCIENLRASSNCRSENTEHVVSNLVNNVENTNVIETCSNNKLINDSQSSAISICKLKDSPFTSPEQTELHEFVNVKNIKVENICNSEMFSFNNVDTNSIEPHSICLKMLEETSMLHKRKNHYPTEDDTSIKRRKRKANDSGNDIAPKTQSMEVSNEPQVDPLFIASSNVQNTTIANVDSKGINPLTVAEHNSRDITSESSDEDEDEYDDEDEDEDEDDDDDDDEDENDDETYMTSKTVLGDLNIKSNIATKEMFENAMKRLYDLKVQIIHNIPPQHRIEHTAGSRHLTKVERQLFLNHGPIKNNAYTPHEDETIKNNWKTFCEIHNWDPKHIEPFLRMRNGKHYYIRSMTERQKFIQFIANGLPGRTLYSVYRRFRSMNGKYEKTFKRYTLVEDEQILLFMKNKRENQTNQNFCDLAKMLGRKSRSVWLRYQLLKKMQESHIRKPLSKIKWTLPLIGTFIKTIMDVISSEKVEDLKDAVLPKSVWLTIGEKLSIDHNILKLLWMHQLHMQLFCPEPIYLNDIKIKLIECIYRKGISHIQEIIWPDIVKYFEGVTTVFLCKVFFYLVKEATVKVGTNEFPYIVDYLYTDKIHDIKNELTDKFLPRLSYNDGNVEIIDKDTSDN